MSVFHCVLARLFARKVSKLFFSYPKAHKSGMCSHVAWDVRVCPHRTRMLAYACSKLGCPHRCSHMFAVMFECLDICECSDVVWMFACSGVRLRYMTCAQNYPNVRLWSFDSCFENKACAVLARKWCEFETASKGHQGMVAVRGREGERVYLQKK